jgi:NDP-sugar pyrophosphorylase family protein
MVLAAGLGTRMRPLTDLLAKPALPVLNRPLIVWTLERLAAHGVTDVVINLHHLPGTVRRAVAQGGELGLRVTFSFERTILGTGGGPRRLRRFLGDEPFLLVNGDMLFDLDLTRLVARHRAAGALATLALRPNPNPRVYAPVVTLGDGRIVWLPGVRRRRAGRVWLFAGIHVMEPSLLDRLPAGPRDSVRDLYAPLVERDQRLLGVPLRGPWFDLGTPELYRRGQLALLRQTRRRPGSNLIDAGAVVAEDALVRGSVIGPGAIVASRARVSRSILWPGARVGEGAFVRDAVVATRAQIGRGARLLGGVAAPRWRRAEA